MSGLVKGQLKVKIMCSESAKYRNMGYRLGTKFKQKIDGRIVCLRFAYKKYEPQRLSNFF